MKDCARIAARYRAWEGAGKLTTLLREDPVMAPTPDTSNRFVLEVFDCTLWCPKAQAPFHVSDVNVLRSILGLSAHQDPSFGYAYPLNDEHIAAIVSAFNTFDPRQLEDNADLEIWLSRFPGVFDPRIDAPYLVHTNYELPLLLEDRKKLAWFVYAYPREEAFAGEEAFDRWVTNGVLHKEVVYQPFEKPVGDLSEGRSVYYTPKGEEWRISAHKLIEKASQRSGGWNDHYERLQGMLFGYEDWQNDWWIKSLAERRALGDASPAMSMHREANLSERDRRFDVQLFIVHPTIDPTEITMALGLDAKFSHRVGDRRITPEGTLLEGNYPHTRWRYSARYTVSNQWFADKVDSLMHNFCRTKLSCRACYSRAEN